MTTPSRVEHLRSKHPRFSYDSFTTERDGDALKLRFQFTIEPDLRFAPETIVESVDWDRVEKLGSETLDLFVFHLGLVEMFSYWKATCAPEIVVKAGFLDTRQLSWWTDLLLHGMREFFYVNQIDFTASDFVHISTPEMCPQRRPLSDGALLSADRDLVLMSGGKDSALAVQLLLEAGRDFHCLLLNPTPTAGKITAQIGDRTPVIIRRTIDPRLLALNQAGYLNGHTPFSAYLAMLGVTCAVLFGYRQVIVANERSADEGNVEFLGTEVNHQYSKTLRFESTFRSYCVTCLTGEVEYFSLLRPLYELQIARLFARYPQYLTTFTSCNRRQKEGGWCRQCAKCFSTFALLYPFLRAEEIHRAFGEDLFARTEAVSFIKELLGFTEHKPFECVGTREEMLVALYLGIQRGRARSVPLPPALRFVETEVLPQHLNLPERAENLLSSWGAHHHVPLLYVELLNRHLRHLRHLAEQS
jgi:hypothetical protein